MLDEILMLEEYLKERVKSLLNEEEKTKNNCKDN